MIKKKDLNKFLILLLIFLFLFSLISVIKAPSSLYSYNSVWNPNPTGLNTRIRLGRFFRFEYVALQNQTFYARYNSTNYYLNVTGGSNVQITLNNWFDMFGTTFRTDRAVNLTLFTGSQGAPSLVNGATYTYFPGNTTLDLEISGASSVGIHYRTGATVYVSNPDRRGFYHSTESPPAYRSLYGFGIIRAGYYQYGFQVRCFYNNSRADITNITLSLGPGLVNYTYIDATSELIESYDPNDYCDIAEEWYVERGPGAWVSDDPTNHYLTVGFNLYFPWISYNESIPAYWFPRYQPYLTQQNCTATINDSIHNEQPAIFYIGLGRLPQGTPVFINWSVQFLLIGLGGCFTLILGFFYGAYKVKQGDIPTGLAIGLAIVIIGLGLIMVWLWR